MEKMLDCYIYDYMLKRDLLSSARAFLTERQVATDTKVVDVPGGLLLKFWSKSWDNYITSSDGKESDSTAAHIEMQQSKARQQKSQLQQMEQSNWDSEKILDLYIYDYMLKRNLNSSARAFLTEGELATDTEVVDKPGGFLLAWWSKFWDRYIKSSNRKGSDSTAAHIEVQMQNPSSQMAPKQNYRKRKHCSNQIDNLETFGNAGFLEGNVGTVSLPDGGAGFSLGEVGWLRAENELTCCHFSSDGKFLAVAGHGKKAVLWNMNTLGIEYTLEQHQHMITDVRFRPESTQLATSSLDKSVRIWDADNPGYCLHAYTRHPYPIMSLDFHPNQNDLFCFCDARNGVHYWSVNPFSSTRVSKQEGKACVRFQPINGHLLAAASDNVVSIYDVESDKQTHSLQGHTGAVRYLCWDLNGDRLASVSNDRIKIWSLASGECIHELINADGKRFHCCVFHHVHSDLLVVGGLRSMELWNTTENIMMSMPAHEDIVGALAQSPQTGTIASAGHDGLVKLWG